MFDYKLKFETEQQANDVINAVTDSLHESQYVRYDIGQIKRYDYDDNDVDAEPTVTIVSDKWHVDLRLRQANESLDEHTVNVKTPAHGFS